MCLGIASDKAGKGENWLSSQNRNFENRMGQGSIAWLASAPTVAASALNMRITDPRPLLEELSPAEFASYLKPAGLTPEIHISEPEAAAGGAQSAAAAPVAITNGVIQGHAQLFGDNVDTDAIIPGEFCHLTEPAAIADAPSTTCVPTFGRASRAAKTFAWLGKAGDRLAAVSTPPGP